MGSYGSNHHGSFYSLLHDYSSIVPVTSQRVGASPVSPPSPQLVYIRSPPLTYIMAQTPELRVYFNIVPPSRSSRSSDRQ